MVLVGAAFAAEIYLAAFAAPKNRPHSRPEISGRIRGP